MKKRMNLRLFDLDANLIDRSGAESLIPEQYAREIIQGVVSESAVLRMGRRLPNMSSNKYRMPVLDMLPMAYFVNGDNGQKKTTKTSWDKKYITAEEIAVIVPIPEAVLEDADYDIWGEVRPRVQEAFGKVIDGAVLFGVEKPASWRDDLVATATKAGSVVKTTADLYADIMGEDGVIAKVEQSGYFVNGHVADISVRAKLRGLKDTTGQPISKPICSPAQITRWTVPVCISRTTELSIKRKHRSSQAISRSWFMRCVRTLHLNSSPRVLSRTQTARSLIT